MEHAPPPTADRVDGVLPRRRRLGYLLTPVLAVLAVAAILTASSTDAGRTFVSADSALPSLEVSDRRPFLPRDLSAYEGQGAWVDVFDFAPAYAGSPSITPSAVDAMAERGVTTLYLQAARWDDDTPAGIVDPALLWAFLDRAHRHGMFVVGWYLPHFADVEGDLERLRKVRDFHLLGERFDGIAVDIEYTEGVPDVEARNAALVDLSLRFRAETPHLPISAVVIPAVQLEVVNEQYWPDFPYTQIAAAYDIWQPMAYWSYRLAPYDDGYRYVKESVDRLRDNLGAPAALVAPIGGVADETRDVHMGEFAQALADTGSIGGSMYDWNTLPPGRQWLLRDAFENGPAKDLPPAPEWRPRTVG